MTVELEDARVKVAQFQKQCEEYLVVIVQQKMDADEQQKVHSTIYNKYCTVEMIIIFTECCSS